jgi:hypothetical protein
MKWIDSTPSLMPLGSAWRALVHSMDGCHSLNASTARKSLTTLGHMHGTEDMDVAQHVCTARKLLTAVAWPRGQLCAKARHRPLPWDRASPAAAKHAGSCEPQLAPRIHRFRVTSIGPA